MIKTIMSIIASVIAFFLLVEMIVKVYIFKKDHYI